MNNPFPKRCRGSSNQHASVLVPVLIIVTTLTILTAGLAFRTRIEIRLASANAARAQAYYLALGGIERALTLLSHQEELSPEALVRTCQFTGTAQEEGLFEQFDEFGASQENALTYCLRDEQGYLNINKSDPAGWENVGCVSRECQAAIIDWMDADDDPSPDGAETDFYASLESPYVSKNRPFVLLRELLFSKAVTQRVYTGEDLNRNLLLDENERDGLLRPPPDNRDNVLDPGLVDVFTVYGNGKININTTSKTILASLPGLDAEVADIILSYRAGPDGYLGTDDDVPFANDEDLAKPEGLTELQIELLGQYCGFDSQHFRIFSHARVDDAEECYLIVTVKYAENALEVLYLERLL